MAQEARTSEQVARNDDAFRKANERLELGALAVRGNDPIPFLCECAEPGCTEVILLSLEEYEAIRRDSRTFVNVPGHEASANGWAEVVADRGHYVVVEKIGAAGVLADALDDRRLHGAQGQVA